MSESYQPSEINDVLSELNDDWKQGPWKRRVTGVQFVNYQHCGPLEHKEQWDNWTVGLFINNTRCKVGINIENDGSLTLYGSNSQFAGQVQRWSRRVALLVLLMSSERFREMLQNL